MRIHELWVKRFLIPYLESGAKKIEIRTRNPKMENILVGDVIFFNQIIGRQVIARRFWDSIEEALEVELVEKVAPGYSSEKILNAWRAQYGRNAGGKVIVFEFS